MRATWVAVMIVTGCGGKAAGPVAPTEPARVLPDGRVELPPSRVETLEVPPGITWHRTPGVAVVHRCRKPGADDAPTVAVLQKSGDPAIDGALVGERIVRDGEEVPAPLTCTLDMRVALSPPAQPAKRVVVPPGDFLENRVSGIMQIFPPDNVKRQMGLGGKDVHVMIRVKVCVDQAGRVDDVQPLSSSGFLGYDLELVNRIAEWRYAPYQIDGAPAAVCSIVQFGYNQRNGKPVGRPWSFSR